MNYFLSCLCIILSSTCFAAKGYQEPWGKGAHLAVKAKTASHIPPPRKDLPSRMAEVLIAFRQNVLSQADGPRSHFRPSSSEYMKLAIRRHGFVKGYLMGCDRLMRENKDPWVYRTTILWNQRFKYDEP